MASLLLFLALAGLVEGKPIRITLCIGAKRPNLGGHWKYLEKGERQAEIIFHSYSNKTKARGQWVSSRALKVKRSLHVQRQPLSNTGCRGESSGLTLLVGLWKSLGDCSQKDDTALEASHSMCHN